ncbi:hypothetical protein IPM62_01945 [Candidatus Woesebacteria bacterium]|nr:MAG: hypothetical protein IPM62_01945 [Candidatus Woesebacteria bacterium]
MKDRLGELIIFAKNVPTFIAYGSSVYFGTDAQVSQQPPYGSEPQNPHHTVQVDAGDEDGQNISAQVEPTPNPDRCRASNLDSEALRTYLAWRTTVGGDKEKIQEIIDNGGLSTMGGNSSEVCKPEVVPEVTVFENMTLEEMQARVARDLQHQMDEHKAPNPYILPAICGGAVSAVALVAGYIVIKKAYKNAPNMTPGDEYREPKHGGRVARTDVTEAQRTDTDPLELWSSFINSIGRRPSDEND